MNNNPDTTAFADLIDCYSIFNEHGGEFSPLMSNNPYMSLKDPIFFFNKPKVSIFDMSIGSPPIGSPQLNKQSLSLPYNFDESLLNNMSLTSPLTPLRRPILKSSKKCSCNAIRCVRLKCECFKNGLLCGEQCGCKSCLNREIYREVREEIKEKTEFINPIAFKKKKSEVSDTDKKPVNALGCQCKSGCNNGYCSCLKLGTGCSPICRCLSCKNDFTQLSKEEVKRLHVKDRRKKQRLVITEDEALGRKESFTFADTDMSRGSSNCEELTFDKKRIKVSCLAPK